jgi:ribosome-associated protein
MIEIIKGVFVDEKHFAFKFSRSSGPGGQNVNKLNSRATLMFDIAGCDAFADEQKQLILKRLSTRANKDGVIRVICQKYRTQRANRDGALERLRGLLNEAVKKRKPRKKTSVPAWVRQKRLVDKKRRALLKKHRASVVDYQ